MPLCDKSVDMAWLCAQGFHVVGAELSEQTVQQIFKESEVQAVRTGVDGITRYQAQGIEIYVGDVSNLTAEIMGDIPTLFTSAVLW